MNQLILLTLALIMLCSPACRQGTSTPPSVDKGASEAGVPLRDAWREYVTLETVKSTDHPGFITTTGRVGFDEEHTQHVGAPVNGRISRVRVAPGDTVRVGQPLAELASSDVAELQAGVKKARQDLVLAEKEAGRARHLHDDGAISDKELAVAEAELEKARAETERGEATLAALGVDARGPLVRAALVARVAGTVVERNALMGQEVRADSDMPLFTISRLDRVWVTADIYEQDLGLVDVGSLVRVRVSAYGDEVFAGRVAHIGDVLNAQTRTVKIRCVLENPGRRLKPEMFAKVDVQLADAGHVISVPVSALVGDGDTTQVLTVTDNHTVQPRKVQVGREINGRQRITEGLRDGDVIVTKGAIFLAKEIHE